MTPKFLQSGALFALTLLLAPLAARADEVMFRGQKIEYGGASCLSNWVVEYSDDFVLDRSDK